jgi:major membrane immunogen (membrane-anchored lipoprotein)
MLYYKQEVVLIMVQKRAVWTQAFFVSLFTALILVCSACSSREGRIHDGYFTAEAAAYDNHGWKEFVSLYVNNGKIVTVEYNAKNQSGFIKSWDMDYMRRMNAIDGTYPNQYTRSYAVSLLNNQDPAGVDAITGATDSYKSFKLLARAALDEAMKGNKKTVFIEIPEDDTFDINNPGRTSHQ